MNLRTLLLSAPLAAVLACGGSSGTGSASLDAATPSFSKLAMDQVAADTTPPAAAIPVLSTTVAPTELMGTGAGCHPHLLLREREVVERVNRHVYKVLGRIERLLATNPVSETSTEKTWTKVENGITYSFTIRYTTANRYAWELDAGPTPTDATPLPVVMTGYIDRSTATGAHEGFGEMQIDFAKLHAAFPFERAASGTLDVAFNVSATRRLISAVATDVVWELDASHFDGGYVPPALEQPRSGAYVYLREPGKGGSLQIQDQMAFGCLMTGGTTTADLTPADARMVSRWYRTSDGTVHGRSDGEISGGPFASGPIARIVGVTCHDASAEQHMPSEGFWLVKAEGPAPDYATVLGFSTASVGETGATPCDPELGAVPLLADSTNDFSAWPTADSYTSGTPFPFPGMTTP